MLKLKRSTLKNNLKKILGESTVENYEKLIIETKKHLSKVIKVSTENIHELDLDDIIFSPECIMTIREKLYEFILNTYNSPSRELITFPGKYINQFTFWAEKNQEKRIILFWQPVENLGNEFVLQIPQEEFEININKSLIN